MISVEAITCPACGDTIYSRARHDFRYCTCQACAIDGGFDYIKICTNTNIDPNTVRGKTLKLRTTKKALYKDWNESLDKYGLIRQKARNV